MSENLIVVSVDSHATMPPEAWPEYLEKRYHEFLPQLSQDNEATTSIFGRLIDQQFGPEKLEFVDQDHAYRFGGVTGLWNADVRLAEMDREGVAAEFAYYGDPRANSMFHGASNRRSEADLSQAGVRAYHRWASDTFGSHKDRILLVGATGPCNDLDQLLAELEWISEHGFAGTYPPGFTPAPDTPPLFDEYWEPFWRMCEERKLPLFVHAGMGMPQGLLFDAIEAIQSQVAAEGGADVDWVDRFLTLINADGDFFADVTPRKSMWQIMLGGVFDRHPDLKLVMTEVRGDWLPATLRHLDEAYLRARAELPASRKPSEYWQSHCLTSLSFVHRAEVAIRHEIGIQTISFGRDYPHSEGTWPNTKEWLSDAFAGVPDDELRLMLGENAVRVLGLDRARLADIAERIGPTIEEITGREKALDPRLIRHFDTRGGYLKPAEGSSKLAQIDEMLRTDLQRAGVTA